MNVNVNGKNVPYQESEDGIFIKRIHFEDQTPINGILANASYCPSQNSSKKWKVELKKHIARSMNRSPWLAVFEKREDALLFIQNCDKIFKHK